MTRPAWIEIDMTALRGNLRALRADLPASVGFAMVVKDEAYGHGAAEVARAALEAGARFLAVANVDEAERLRAAGVSGQVLVLGERTPEELEICARRGYRCCVGTATAVDELDRVATAMGVRAHVHLEIETGMGRYGVRWTEALAMAERIAGCPSLELEGVMSHFAMSDEADKTFALVQLRRFTEVLQAMGQRGIAPPVRHLCNSGGVLDLPGAHLDMVRTGILPLGVYPSRACRRIVGIDPVMTVKCRVVALRRLEVGDNVGYGLRYQAASRTTIAVLPIGYGDGYPRVRNQGVALIHGEPAPIVGGNAMDATMVDVTGIPQATVGDEVILMGRQGAREVSVHDLATLASTVSYQILCGWRSRLPRVYLDPRRTS